MSKSKPLTVVNFDGLPVSFIINPIFSKRSPRLDEIESDLLVFDHHEHMYLGAGPKDFDTVLDGAIGEAIKRHQFEGEIGDSVLVRLPDKKIKNVLVVGLGKPGMTHRRTMCGFVGLLLESAREVGAKRITLPVFPGQLGSDISVSGTLAILRCRLAACANSAQGIGDLKEIEILCTSQAKRFIVDGLEVGQPLCAVCVPPRLA